MTTNLALPAKPVLPELSASLGLPASLGLLAEPAAQPEPAAVKAVRALSGLRDRLPTVVLFATVSFSSWTVDYVLALLLNSLTGSVLCAVVGARMVSCTMSLLLNRRLFRAAPETFWRSVTGYAAVQATTTTMSYLGIALLTGTGAPLWLAKILVDSSLFGLSYLLQSRRVYRSGSTPLRLGPGAAIA